MPARVVFDTNILISALLSLTGAPFRCLALARSGAVQSVTCPEIMAEFADKLRTKFAFGEGRIEQTLAELSAFSEIVEISGALRVVLDDPDDDKIVECAVVGDASIIVSGDKHLRRLARHDAILILSANEFLRSAE
jgi:putative PIN family toxin of toxin-antitoxin system